MIVNYLHKLPVFVVCCFKIKCVSDCLLCVFGKLKSVLFCLFLNLHFYLIDIVDRGLQSLDCI